MRNTSIQSVLDEVGSLAFAGFYDTLSAKIAERVGFPLGFVSGYSVAATTIGEPDMGLLTQTEMIERARKICSSVSIPVIIDADTGYGNPLNVYRTVIELIDAGAKGCFLEDQIWPKKCGHMRGKRVIERQEYIHKIRAAVDARDGRDFFIVARTDAEQAVGLDEAIARVTEAREAGADGSFVEAPGSIEQLEEIGRRSPHPNVANMIEGGKTPLLSKDRLSEMGFHLILYPLAGLYVSAASIQNIFQELFENGTTMGKESSLMTFESFNDLIGVDAKYRFAEQYGVD